MRRPFGPLIAAFALFVALPPAGAQKSAVPTLQTFSFLDFTDTQQTAQGTNEPLRQLAQTAAAMSPRPAFVIATGNLTDTGRPEEFEKFKAALAPLDSAGIKFYALPGSHDIRWNPQGKDGFVQQFGKLYQSFDYGGAHFVLLDTTVMLEHWGHFDKPELDWLGRDLKRLRPETPIFLFMHHWIGRDEVPSARMIDNEFDLFPILRGHNVVAIFTGHGQRDLVWRTNGIETLMARGLYQGSYYKVDVSSALVTIDRYSKEKPDEAAHIASLSVAAKAHPSVLKVAWDDPDVPYLARRRPSAILNPRAVTDNPEQERAEYRIDDGVYKPLTKNARDIWQDQFLTQNLSIGIHSCDIKLTTSNNVTYEDELIFEVERDNREPTRKWAINLDGAIQSSPLLDRDMLYVSSLDGRLYALNINSGKRRWAFPSHGQFFASPVLDGNLLYIGSTDHVLYALDVETGRPIWHFDAGGPIFATAGVTQGVVCVPAAGNIYGLDARSGSLKWTRPAAGLFQSRVAGDHGTFYLGGWNTTLYALDAATGNPHWTKKIGKTLFYAPAVASPALGNGRVYICSADGVLHAFNAASGNEDWSAFAPPGEDPFGYSSPVVVGLTIYMGGLGNHGDVYAIDTATGKEQWHTSTGQTIFDSSPRLSPDGRSLAIMGVRGHVAILSTSTGKSLWSYELGPGNIFSTPEYDGSLIYTTTMAHDVQAINGPGVGATK